MSDNRDYVRHTYRLVVSQGEYRCCDGVWWFFGYKSLPETTKMVQEIDDERRGRVAVIEHRRPFFKDMVFNGMPSEQWCRETYDGRKIFTNYRRSATPAEVAKLEAWVQAQKKRGS